MRIGTIGAGEVALAVAREALARGHEIVLSSRSGPGALANKVTELGRGASAATVEEAANLDYVLLAVPWKIVKAFNSIRMARFNEGPVKGQGRRVIFVSGDDEESKRVVKDLIESFGFAAIDLGGLVTGGRIQQAGGPLAGLDLFVAA